MTNEKPLSDVTRGPVLSAAPDLAQPDMAEEVMRPDRIRARWMDEHGKTHEQDLDGLLAVCLQHEMDHLEGVLFIDHLSKLKRDMVLKKLAKQRKERGLRAA